MSGYIRKKLYDKPDYFIFYQTVEEDQEFVDYIKIIQKTLEELGHEPKILLNCPITIKLNSLNTCFAVKEKMETDEWWNYGHCITNKVFIKNLKREPEELANELHLLDKDTETKDYEFITN